MAKKYTTIGISPETLARLRMRALAWQVAAINGNPASEPEDIDGVSMDAAIKRLLDRADAAEARDRRHTVARRKRPCETGPLPPYSAEQERTANDL